jgi:multiple sugar transport system ATP-binding protein
MAMIFQNYALYPHMNVYDNMGFGLRMRGIDRAEIKRRVGDAARVLGLSEVLSKRPRHLSGGQRQRVAMGRAIVREPQAFLMDEPLSNLDAKLRVQMRAEIARIQRSLGVTTIYVTHDQSEAMTLGDRVCVLRGGLLQQVDRPQVLYDRPANLFVAGFIGSPAMNLVVAELGERDGSVSVRFGPHELPVTGRPELRAHAGRRIALGIRPEDIRGAGDGAPLEVTVDIKEDMGAEVYLHFAVDAPPVRTEELREIVGEEALEAADEQTQHHGSPFVARVERGISAREGERTRLVVDTSPRESSPSADAEGAVDRRAATPAHDLVRAADVELDRHEAQLARGHEDRPPGDAEPPSGAGRIAHAELDVVAAVDALLRERDCVGLQRHLDRHDQVRHRRCACARRERSRYRGRRKGEARHLFLFVICSVT